MMTGAMPGRSGIAANAFALYAPLANADTCERTGPFDYSAMPAGTSGESPTCPRGNRLRERRQAGGQAQAVDRGDHGRAEVGRIFDVDFRGRHAADHLWAPCASDTPEDDSYCADVPTNPITGYAQDDATVMNEVLRTVAEGIHFRGRTRRPAFAFVNLPRSTRPATCSAAACSTTPPWARPTTKSSAWSGPFALAGSGSGRR